MSVDEYFRLMQVKHVKNCKVCRDMGENMHLTRFKPVTARLWQKAWFVWLLVLIGFIGAYYGFYWLIYLLVGSI